MKERLELIKVQCWHGLDLKEIFSQAVKADRVRLHKYQVIPGVPPVIWIRLEFDEGGKLDV